MIKKKCLIIPNFALEICLGLPRRARLNPIGFNLAALRADFAIAKSGFIMLTYALLGIMLIMNLTLVPHLYSAEKKVTFPSVSAGVFEFYKEKIIIYVKEDFALVEGYYYLKNITDSDKEMFLFYPFFLDKFHPYPEEINIYEKKSLGEKDVVNFIKHDKGIIWKTNIKAGSKKCIKVIYKQKIINNDFTYILTTTKFWQKGLKQANYVIIIPRELKDVELSYLPDKIKIKKEKVHYYINKKNFMPEHDLNIRWKKE